MSQIDENKIPEDLRISYKKLCVAKRENKQYVPQTIPRERSLKTTIIQIAVIVVLFLVHLFLSNTSWHTTLARYAVGFLFILGVQILHRVILVFEEISHVISRYDGHYLKLLKASFSFPASVSVVAILSTVYYLIQSSNYTIWTILTLDAFSVFCLVPSLYFLGNLLGLNHSPLNDSLWIAQNNGLDYGSGMAYSFFNGYLKLVLPKTGDKNPHLKELMEDYESSNSINFPVRKLLILIPQSMKCFVSLEDASKYIEESKSLDEKLLTVAGVKNRSYKNSVYKIATNGSKTYVSAEYATPIKTFKDVVDSGGHHSDFYRKHKNDIVLQFYLTLNSVLQREGYQDLCELIYYEDSYLDSSGKVCYHDVGKIILSRVKELKKQQNHDKSE